MDVENIEGIADYWRASYRVQAVRLSEDNMPMVAKFVGCGYSANDSTFVDGPYLCHLNQMGFVGDWYAFIGGIHQFFSHEEFKSRFRKHETELDENEKYAKIYQLVKSAMNKQDTASSYYGGDPAAMDLIAIETTKKILGEL